MFGSLIQEIRSLDMSRRSLRSFGLMIGCIVLLIGLGLLWRLESTALSNPLESEDAGLPVITSFAGIALILIGAVAPRLLGPLYVVWMVIAVVLGAVMSRVVLTVVFVLLIVPTGLVMRLTGRDPLRRRISDSSDSNWISRDDMDRSVERLEKYY